MAGKSGHTVVDIQACVFATRVALTPLQFFMVDMFIAGTLAVVRCPVVRPQDIFIHIAIFTCT